MSLTFDYVPLRSLNPSPTNLKRHDVGAIAQSIQRYGFRDVFLLDAETSTIVAGHGRDKALKALQRAKEPPPNGVTLSATGEWLVPVVKLPPFQSEAEKRAYLIDHNLLTMAGGEYLPADMLKMFDDGFTEELQALASAEVLPVSFDGDTLDALLSLSDVEPEQMGGQEGDRLVECPECGHQFNPRAK